MSLLLLVFRLLSHELGGDQLRRLGQKDPFGLLHHPPLQDLRRVAGEHRDGLLQEDLSAVGNVVYIMHGGAGVLDAPGQGGFLMRASDVLLTKPGELSFYPVPKLMLHRVGGHEMWGAIRAAEVGDGSYECEKTEEVLAMLDEITNGDEILPALCRCILRAKAAGIYNGAYEAVKLAVGK